MGTSAAGARIGFDAIRALRNPTGLGNYARGVLQGLHAAAPAMEPFLYAPRAPHPDFAGLPAQLGATLRLPAPVARRSPLRQIWRTWRLGRVAARDGIALYHGLTQEIPRDLPATGIPSVVTIHDLLFHSHPELFRAFDRRSYLWRYRWSAERATAVVTVSQWTREQLHDAFGIPRERIAVVQPARDPRFAVRVGEAARRAARERQGLPERFLISVGTLEPRKNQRQAIAAMAHLDPATPPLVLVGRDGGSAAALQGEIDRLRLDGRVLLRTGVTDAELPALVQSAAVALYLSTAEGFGMPIIEAMSAGVPVIAGAGPHLGDASGDAAIQVDAHDTVGLADAIERLMRDPREAGARAALGVRHAGTFDQEPLARRLLAVYDAVLDGTRLPEVGTPAPVPSRPEEILA